jgi:hypothetical protein
MRLVLAKSTFDHPETDDTVTPGKPLLMKPALAQSLVEVQLAEAPRPGFHHQVEEGPMTDDGDVTALYHKGGGVYLVLDDTGAVLNDKTLKGVETARKFAHDYSAQSE